MDDDDNVNSKLQSSSTIQQRLVYQIISNYIMEPEFSLSCLQNDAIGPCAEPVQDNPHQLGPEVFLGASIDTAG